MLTKLTPTVDREVVDRAKRYAQCRHRSVSRIIENYLRILSVDEPIDGSEEIVGADTTERLTAMFADVDTGAPYSDVLDVATGCVPSVVESKPVLAFMEQRRAIGYVSAHSVTTMFYILRKIGGAHRALAFLTDLLSIVSVATEGDNDIVQANENLRMKQMNPIGIFSSEEGGDSRVQGDQDTVVV